MQIDKDNDLWVLTNTLPRFIYGKLDTNEYNFRIWRTNVFEAIRGTVCDWKHGHGHGFENKWNDHDDDDDHGYGPRGEHGYGHSGEREWDRDHEMNWDRSGGNWKGSYNGGRNGYKHH